MMLCAHDGGWQLSCGTAVDVERLAVELPHHLAVVQTKASVEVDDILHTRGLDLENELAWPVCEMCATSIKLMNRSNEEDVI